MFFVSDTHFDHERILSIRNQFNSVDEMNCFMLDNWNSNVSINDKVYHLGDVSFKKNALYFIDMMNGKKCLIKGNHDIYPIKEYLKYFYDIRGAHEFKYKGLKICLTHIPIHEQQMKRYDLNIHGHLHNEPLDDKRYFCASVENIGYTPIHIDEVLTRCLI